MDNHYENIIPSSSADIIGLAFAKPITRLIPVTSATQKNNGGSYASKTVVKTTHCKCKLIEAHMIQGQHFVLCFTGDSSQELKKMIESGLGQKDLINKLLTCDEISSFALIHKEEAKLALFSRWPYGRPFYWNVFNNKLYFTHSLKSFVQRSGQSITPSFTSIATFFWLGITPLNSCLANNVQVLAPGQLLQADLTKETFEIQDIQSYRDLFNPEQEFASYQDLKQFCHEQHISFYLPKQNLTLRHIPPLIWEWENVVLWPFTSPYNQLSLLFPATINCPNSFLLRPTLHKLAHPPKIANVLLKALVHAPKFAQYKINYLVRKLTHHPLSSIKRFVQQHSPTSSLYELLKNNLHSYFDPNIWLYQRIHEFTAEDIDILTQLRAYLWWQTIPSIPQVMLNPYPNPWYMNITVLKSVLLTPQYLLNISDETTEKQIHAQEDPLSQEFLDLLFLSLKNGSLHDEELVTDRQLQDIFRLYEARDKLQEHSSILSLLALETWLKTFVDCPVLDKPPSNDFAQLFHS